MLIKLGTFLAGFFMVSDQRKLEIYGEIEQGSDPRFNYYLLLFLSAQISAFGLIANSPAVVIGAMLVCPLMTPIFGISLSLVTGNTRLLRSALIAETGGVILAVVSSFVVGISPFSFEVTQEILKNTSPTLLDLFVAALAGFAGCMAMIDARISPILPGIAIATSLTPPLSACGLCIALGAYEGGMGAFVMFLANFLTILFVASVTFIAAGFIKGRLGEHKREFARRFFLAAVSMVALVWFLSNAMMRLVEEKTATSKIREAMFAELGESRNPDIREITLDRSRDGKSLNAMVVMDAEKEPSPFHLKAVEERLRGQLDKTVNLFVQTRITRSVSSSQDKLIQFYRSADGIEEIRRPGRDMQALSLAGQIVRERMEQMPGMLVTDIELRRGANGARTIHTTVQGPIRPFPGGMAKIEQRIRQALGDPDIRLVARYMESYEVSTEGVNRDVDKSADPESLHLQKLAATEISKIAGLQARAVKAGRVDGSWVVVAEVGGTTVMTAAQATAVQDSLRKAADGRLQFVAYSKAETLVRGSE